ncbi:MAG: dipeptide ABC transporter ATP-binding protein [Rhizobiales bacterium]|nr:dipeptide ABC transporter ATP-binding protein [Hyphomicrobiales bacterium]
MASELLKVENLAVTFAGPTGEVQAVRDVSFRVRPGSCVAIVGESGSGKSVTARAILGILPRSARIVGGRILFADKGYATARDLAALAPDSEAYRAVRGGRISMIFQEPMTSLSPLHTVGNQIAEALELHQDLKSGEVEARCLEMLRLVRFPDPDRAFRSYPFELSGGLRQRAMIAMALVCGPALLIADEPTTALDVTVQAQILGLIKDLQRDLGMAVLLITHDMGVVANIAEEVVVVYKGEVMEAGTIGDILGDPQHDYLKALLRAVPRIEGGGTMRLQPLREINPEIGKMLGARTEAETAGQHAGAGPLLEVRGLVKRYTIRNARRGLLRNTDEQHTAVDRVSFSIERGECLGLVGESGCGKTTVSKMILGGISSDEGEILFRAEDGGQVDMARLDDSAMRPYRKRIQYVFQDPFGSLNPRMTTFDILSEPLQIHGIGDKAWRREMVQEAMRLVGLDPRYLNRYPHSFSGGQRQRIGIARALMLRPELVICDEPVSALDVSTQAQVLNLLKDLQERLALTFLFISHDLAVVNYIADRIAVMSRGKLVEVGPREAIFNRPRHPYTRALLGSVPTPDLGRLLDFEAIRDTGLTEPENWPYPFGGEGGSQPSLLDLGGGHMVRAYEATEAS